MIKPSELRVGNLVQTKTLYMNGGKIIRVEQVSLLDDGIDGVQNDNDECIYGVDFHDLEGIPLTEKWEIRLKPKEDSTIYIKKCGNYYDVLIQSPSAQDEFYNPIKRINFVHEWQNLYFAWEGEELTVKI